MKNRELQVMNFRESDVLRAQRRFDETMERIDETMERIDETMERIDRSMRRAEITAAAIYGAIAGMAVVVCIFAI